MPKELTHWMIARAAALTIDERATPHTAHALRTCPDGFLLGAVAHDSPFYLPKEPGMADLGAKLHGKGVDDAYAPIKRVLAGTTTPCAIAFAAGALSHSAADTVFHPAVFYFTGFAAHPNRRVSGAYSFRHRSFEAAMDLHLLTEHGKGIDRLLKDLLARIAATADAKDVIGALARFYGADVSADEARRIIRQAGKTQRLFFSTPLRLLARLMNMGTAGTNRDISGLFYTRASTWHSHLTAPHAYRDPILGTDGIFDLRAFFQQAVDRTSSLFNALEHAIAGDAHAFPYPGPCLDSGHAVNDDQVMKYCDPGIDRRP